jgi:pantoate--beta-alanine ligase
VVAKLFNMVQPDRAYFGEKDYQQLQVISTMTRDLDFPVEIVPCATVREPDGLAMSSRNRFLSREERAAALSLSRALNEGRSRFAAGERSAPSLAAAARAVLESEPLVRLEYVEVADAETLAPIGTIERSAVLLIAARVGTTRLIDNCPLRVDD